MPREPREPRVPPAPPAAAPAPCAPCAAALVIGNEILSGKVEEANVAVLARALRGLGILLRRVVVVLDDVDTIAPGGEELSAAHDWLFTSGGVGPTHDDVTIEAVAQALSACGSSPSPEMEGMLRRHYGERCTRGTPADGARCRKARRSRRRPRSRWPTVRVRNTWLLPGIPEVFRMKLPVLMAHIAKSADGQAFLSHAVYAQIDEGVLKPMLDRVVGDFPDVSVGSYPKWHDPTYRTKVTFDGRDEARVLEARDAFIATLPPGEPQRVD